MVLEANQDTPVIASKAKQSPDFWLFDQEIATPLSRFAMTASQLFPLDCKRAIFTI
ncbi:MAG: hypothetical protein OEU91_00115 [Gammaproteobacteria bacterium]|nr:hypothetical protein [Gammaproteobacteria bacterium]